MFANLTFLMWACNWCLSAVCLLDQPTEKVKSSNEKVDSIH